MELARVLDQFGIRAAQLTSLGAAGGFSGARFWRAASDLGELCIRRCPEHQAADRLSWIHCLLLDLQRQGITIVPVPRPTLDGATWTEHAGALWEVTPWMPGEADFARRPTAVRLQNALRAVAGLHRALAVAQPPVPSAPAPAVADRLRMLTQLLSGGHAQLAAAVASRGDWPELSESADRLLSLFPRIAPRMDEELKLAEHLRVPLQPCLRDLWHDHLLFRGDQVSGIIDFGAMRVESVAGDLARLLGSLVPEQPARWHEALDAYTQIRPLDGDERQLIPVLDRSSTLLGGFLWLQWIYLENRTFVDFDAVLVRVRQAADRLEQLVESHEGKSSGLW